MNEKMFRYTVECFWILLALTSGGYLAKCIPADATSTLLKHLEA